MDQSVTGNITVRISDILGNEVKTMVTDSRKLIINVEDLSEGIYFITLTDHAGFSLSQKIIKSMR
jgi:hypothetical protein